MSAFIPDTYKQTYELETEKKTFQQFKQTHAEKNLIPAIIRLESNLGYNSITGANTLIRIRNASNWKKCSITGLRPTEYKGYYYGDFKVKGVKSLIVFKVESNTITLRVSPQFYPLKKGQLHRIVNYIIQNF